MLEQVMISDDMRQPQAGRSLTGVQMIAPRGWKEELYLYIHTYVGVHDVMTGFYFYMSACHPVVMYVCIPKLCIMNVSH